MSLFQIDASSNVLGMTVPINVIIPSYTPKKVLYLLHGLGDDETRWIRRTSIERYAEEANIAVVMPTTVRGFYTNTKYYMRFWDYISEEVPEFLAKTFRLPTERENTFVAGVSMGGYGTLKLALRKPEMFAAAFAMSAVADIKDWNSTRDESKSVFGDTVSDENDLFYLASTYKNTPEKLPKIYMWCGESDFLLEHNRKFVAYTKELGLDVNYTETPGDHGWKWWDGQIKAFIEKNI